MNKEIVEAISALAEEFAYVYQCGGVDALREALVMNVNPTDEYRKRLLKHPDFQDILPDFIYIEPDPKSDKPVVQPQWIEREHLEIAAAELRGLKLSGAADVVEEVYKTMPDVIPADQRRAMEILAKPSRSDHRGGLAGLYRDNNGILSYGAWEHINTHANPDDIEFMRNTVRRRTIKKGAKVFSVVVEPKEWL
jgi:hypothetical protein